MKLIIHHHCKNYSNTITEKIIQTPLLNKIFIHHCRQNYSYTITVKITHTTLLAQLFRHYYPQNYLNTITDEIYHTPSQTNYSKLRHPFVFKHSGWQSKVTHINNGNTCSQPHTKQTYSKYRERFSILLSKIHSQVKLILFVF